MTTSNQTAIGEYAALLLKVARSGTPAADDMTRLRALAETEPIRRTANGPLYSRPQRRDVARDLDDLRFALDQLDKLRDLGTPQTIRKDLAAAEDALEPAQEALADAQARVTELQETIVRLSEDLSMRGNLCEVVESRCAQSEICRLATLDERKALGLA